MLRRFFIDCSGAMVAEYALMLGVFCTGCLCGALYYSQQISAALDRVGNLIATATGG